MSPLLEKGVLENIQFVRVEQRSKVLLRGGDDGMVYHHLTPTCGFEKWRERMEETEGGVRATKWSERGNERDGEGERTGRKGEGKREKRGRERQIERMG